MSLFKEPADKYILLCGLTGWSVVGLVCPIYPSSSVSPVALSIEPAREYRASSDTSWSVVGLAGTVTIGAVPETSGDKSLGDADESIEALGRRLVSS